MKQELAEPAGIGPENGPNRNGRKAETNGGVNGKQANERLALPKGSNTHRNQPIPSPCGTPDGRNASYPLETAVAAIRATRLTPAPIRCPLFGKGANALLRVGVLHIAGHDFPRVLISIGNCHLNLPVESPLSERQRIG